METDEKHRKNTAEQPVDSSLSQEAAHDPRENLMPPWEKGQSGNPAGRPKGTSLTTLLRQVLDETDPATKKSMMQKLADKLAKALTTGRINSSLLAQVWDRLEGRVPQTNVNTNFDYLVIETTTDPPFQQTEEESEELGRYSSPA